MISLLIALTLALAPGCGGGGSSGPAPEGGTWGVHSWATFTSLQSPHGADLDGVDQPPPGWPASLIEDGPAGRGRLSVDAAVMRVSGEPAGTLELNLADGRLDGWFPEAERADGRLSWSAETAAAAAASDDQPFLFARGASSAAPPLRVESLGEDAYRLTNISEHPVPDALLLRRHTGGWLIWPQETLEAGASVEIASPPPKERVAGVARQRVQDELAAMLGGAGLQAADAAAVQQAWGERWIDVPGVRIVFVAPPIWADTLLPLSATGAQRSERVVVGRVEAVTPELQVELLDSVRAELQGGDAFDPSTLGRFGQPLLESVAEVAQERGDEPLAQRCRELAARVAAP